jgi:hypothetical protein
MKHTILFTCIAIAGFAMAAAGTVDFPIYPKRAHVIQRLRAFDNPEGSIFSSDGKYVFISNAAELGMPKKGFHWTHGAGYVSKLEVQPNGSLKMLNQKLITGLTGPLGMVVSRVSTRKFPRGTIFLTEAWVPLAETDSTEISDPNVLDPKIIAFNEGGSVLGTIKLGAGSTAARVSGVVATLGNSLATDDAGNLYLADTGQQGTQFHPPIKTNGGGVYMFPVDSLDALAEGRSAPMYYIPVPNGGPDGIEVAPNGIIHFNTVGLNAGLQDPAAGGMYALTQSDFVSGTLPPPFNTGLGALDGLQFAGKNRLDTEVRNTNSVVVTPLPGNRTFKLGYDEDIVLSGPADIAVRRMHDGTYLLVIPELSGTSPNDVNNPVTVVRLPADF